MTSFIKKHPSGILVAVTVMLLGALAGIYFWGLTGLAGEINRVVNFAPVQSPGSSFDLKDAAGIDWKGLVTSTAPEATGSLQNQQ